MLYLLQVLEVRWVLLALGPAAKMQLHKCRAVWLWVCTLVGTAGAEGIENEKVLQWAFACDCISTCLSDVSLEHSARLAHVHWKMQA